MRGKCPSFATRKDPMSSTDKLWLTVLHVFFILLSFLILYPFWIVFIESVDDQISYGLRLLPGKFTLEAYKTVLQQNSVGTSFMNSIFRTVVGMTMTVAVTFCAAYVLSKKKLPFNRLMTAYVVIPMFFSGGLIPLYLQISNLKLIDNRWSMILPFVFSGFYILVMRNFMYSIPGDLEESALLDGANELVVAFCIFLPLSLPIIATILLWSAVLHWNEWFYAMIYIRSPGKQVLQMLLRRVLLESQASVMFDNPVFIPPATEKSVRSALLFISTLPILVTYPFAQKYFITGLTMGAVKG